MTINDLKRVQEVGYELLLTVDYICKKHGIEYFLFFGTLLGSIRHNGPIPWDDDIDIAMTRDNYVKFIQISQQEIDSSKYIIQLFGDISLKYTTRAKIGRINTTYCLSGSEKYNIMRHVHIDIFCLDSAKKRHIALVFSIKRTIWSFLRIISLDKDEKRLLLLISKYNKRKLVYRLVIKSLLYFFHLTRYIIGTKIIWKIGYVFFVDKSGLSNQYTIIGSKSVFEKNWFQVSNHLYYDKVFPIPKDFDKILTVIYGKYMTIPPKEKQLNKHFNKWLFSEMR